MQYFLKVKVHNQYENLTRSHVKVACGLQRAIKEAQLRYKRKHLIKNRIEAFNQLLWQPLHESTKVDLEG